MPNVDACDSSKLHVVPFQGESILRALRPLDCRIANPTEAKSGGELEREEGLCTGMRLDARSDLPALSVLILGCGRVTMV